MTGVLTILYVTNVQGFSTARYGTLIAIQMITSILVYIPAGKIADRIGRKPLSSSRFSALPLSPWRLFSRPSFGFLDSCLCHRRAARDRRAFA